MQLLFLVIKELAKAGIRGGTAIDSIGMAKSISDMDSLPMIGVLRQILNGEDASQKGKTIFVAVHDEQVEAAKKAITSVTGDLSKPNAGVLFGVPITFAEGIN